MWPILVFGLLALGGAVRVVIRGEGGLPLSMRYLLMALVSAVGLGTVTDLAATCSALARLPEELPQGQWRTILVQGLAESSSPAILGFIFLSLCAVFLAAGAAKGFRSTST